MLENTTLTNSKSGALMTLGTGSHIDLDTADINGGTLTIAKGTVVHTVNDHASTITGAAITNAGTLAADHGDLTIDGPIKSSNGILEAANSSHLTVTGVVSGKAAGLIDASGIMEFAAASSANVTFGFGANGTLVLDAATNTADKFTGTLSGFDVGDHIELGAIAYTSGDAELLSYLANKTGGMLTVSDGTHAESLKFDGQYTLADFQTANVNGHVDLLHA